MSSSIGVRGAGEGFPSIFNLQQGNVPVRGSESVVRSTPRGIPPAPINGGPSPMTDALTQARFARTTVSNPTQLIGNATEGRGWISLTVDRPSIVWCHTAELSGVLLYAPERQPNRDRDALASTGHGTCYLSGPGVWWIKYQAGDGTTSGGNARLVDVVVHDASDPAVASKFLNEPGVHHCVQTHVSLSVFATTYLVAAENVRRTSLIIQTLTPTVPVRIGIQNALTGFVTANDGNGLRLGGSAGNSLTLQGAMMPKGQVLTRLEFPGGLGELVVAEFF